MCFGASPAGGRGEKVHRHFPLGIGNCHVRYLPEAAPPRRRALTRARHATSRAHARFPRPHASTTRDRRPSLMPRVSPQEGRSPSLLRQVFGMPTPNDETQQGPALRRRGGGGARLLPPQVGGEPPDEPGRAPARGAPARGRRPARRGSGRGEGVHDDPRGAPLLQARGAKEILRRRLRARGRPSRGKRHARARDGGDEENERRGPRGGLERLVLSVVTSREGRAARHPNERREKETSRTTRVNNVPGALKTDRQTIVVRHHDTTLSFAICVNTFCNKLKKEAHNNDKVSTGERKDGTSSYPLRVS